MRWFLNVCFGELSYFSKIYEVLTTVESQRECDIVFHSFHLDNRALVYTGKKDRQRLRGSLDCPPALNDVG